jgi:pimeloyl-ACP methyl ester carboxylesterase
VAGFLNELGLPRPHVAGNSLGGWIALELAKRGRVRSATALSPAGFHNRLEGAFQRRSLMLAVRASRLAAPHAERIFARPRLRKLAFLQLAAHPERIPPAELVATVRDLARAAWFDETLVAINDGGRFTGGGQITAPTTIAWGQHDRLLLPHQARRAARAIPHARIVTLWGCGHVPSHDDPAQVAELLLRASAD